MSDDVLDDGTITKSVKRSPKNNKDNPAFAEINAEIAALKGTGSGKGRSGAKKVSDRINSLKADRLEIAKRLLSEEKYGSH